MTTRANRMKKALEAFGWTVDDGSIRTRDCDACGKWVSLGDKFCSTCGHKLTPFKVAKEETTAWQLEQAMKYALGETRKLP